MIHGFDEMTDSAASLIVSFLIENDLEDSDVNGIFHKIELLLAKQASQRLVYCWNEIISPKRPIAI